MRDYIQGYKDKIQSFDNPVEFLRFFFEDSTLQYSQKVFKKHFEPYLPKGRKTAVEIGYGAGGMILRACKSFEEVIGVDVHASNRYVEMLLNEKDVHNFVLKCCDGHILPLRYADFVYSWTTFQHFGNVSVVLDYLNEIKRVLKVNGRAVIYFARMHEYYKGVVTLEDWLKAVEAERSEGEGFCAVDDAETNQTNLRMSMWMMEDMVDKAGLKVVDRTHSGNPKRVGGQHGVILCQS